MRKKLFKLSGISAILSAVTFASNYVFYHYVTDDGFTTVFQEEAGKPFVSDIIGQLGVHFLFFVIGSLLVAYICFDKEK